MGQSSFKPKRAATRAHNPRKHIDDMYNKDWERYRARFLKVNRDCYACGSLAVVVDHLVPHKGDHKLFQKLDNHVPLCFSCHNTVTSKFDRHYVVGAPIEEKAKWLNSRRFPTDSWNPRRVKVLSYYK